MTIKKTLIPAKPRNKRLTGTIGSALSGSVSSSIGGGGTEETGKYLLKSTFDSMFEWDDTNQAIKAKTTLYSLGGLSALGFGAGANPGGATIDIENVLTSTAINKGLSSNMGRVLNERITSEVATLNLRIDNIIAGGGGGTATWATLTGKPSTFAPSAHTHPISELSDFPTMWAWGKLSGVPGTFAPSAHGHTVANISDFPSVWAWSKLSDIPATFAPSAHTHTKSQITDFPDLSVYALNSSLSNYALVSSLSSYALTSSLSSYSLTSHTHTPSQVGLGNVANESKATMFTNPIFTGTAKAPTFEATTKVKTPYIEIGSNWRLIQVSNHLELQYNQQVRQVAMNEGTFYAMGGLSALGYSASAGNVIIIDNLTSTLTDRPVSANMARVLNESKAGFGVATVQSDGYLETLKGSPITSAELVSTGLYKVYFSGYTSNYMVNIELSNPHTQSYKVSYNSYFFTVEIKQSGTLINTGFVIRLIY